MQNQNGKEKKIEATYGAILQQIQSTKFYFYFGLIMSFWAYGDRICNKATKFAIFNIILI